MGCTQCLWGAGSWWIAFLIAWLIRYGRLIVNLISFHTIKPIKLPLKPTFTAADVTVIIPTIFGEHPEFIACVGSILACRPAKIIIVTSDQELGRGRTEVDFGAVDNVTVIGVDRVCKRLQMVRGVRHAETDIVVFADDDVFWPANYLDYLLAPFEDPKVGAAGTLQRARRMVHPTVWNFLGICYLERRNFATAATIHIDGGISTLSGRTAAFRTCIVKCEAFYDTFLNYTWMGRRVSADDDKCLTRWTYSHGWDIRLQCDSNCILQTTLHTTPEFLEQTVRWARAHWRGNLRVLTEHTYWYRKHPYTCYAVYAASLMTPALVVDSWLAYLLHRALELHSPKQQMAAYFIFATWLVCTKIVKLGPHLQRHPEDIKFLPASIMFSYLHGFINIYALLTLHLNVWGGRDLGQAPLDHCGLHTMDSMLTISC